MFQPLQADASSRSCYGSTTSRAPSPSWQHLRWASSPFRDHEGTGEIQLSSDGDTPISTPSLGTPTTSFNPSPSSAASITPPPPPPEPGSLSKSNSLTRSSTRSLIRTRQKRNRVLILVALCLGVYTVILFVLWNKSILATNSGSSRSPHSAYKDDDADSSSDHDISPSSHEKYSKSSRTSSYQSSYKMRQFLFDHFLPWGLSKSATIAPPSYTTRSILLVLEAEAVEESPYMDDTKRPLTANGIRDAEELGLYLQEHNIEPPDWIFASPSVRTTYTLELIRRNWASRVPVAFEDILYILAFNDYFAFCAGLAFNFHRVMILGHNPAILNTAKKLMDAHGIEDFPYGGFMEIRWTNQPEWRTLVPGTGSTEMAVSPNEVENSFFNVTVTRATRKRRKRYQL